MKILRLLLPLCSILFSSVSSFSFSECNSTRSCWFHPPGCSEAPSVGLPGPTTCVSGVEWTMEEDGLMVQLQSYTGDLDPTRPVWMAVGFSHNQRMNDDTVLECIHSTTGMGRAQVSFNDETSNHVLNQASSVLLSDGEHSNVDGIMTCSMKLLIDNVKSVNEEDRFKIHDIEAKPYYLLFARGNADPFTLEKDIHSTADGAQFPWMTENEVSFCRTNCSETEPQFTMVEESRQTFMERYWRYRVAVMHGVVLLLAWWVLGSNGILIARYFKPMWSRKKLMGTAVWFQLHRSLLTLSVLLQILAVIFIFFQSNWTWYECSYECTNDDFSKKMHAICGVFATCLAVIQPFIAFCRPAPDSNTRKVFNWGHWLIGMTAWSFASATMLMAIPMGKTGLQRVYGHVPNYIMGGYVIVFVVTNVLLEMASSTSERRMEKIDPNVHRFVVGPSGMAMSVINGPSTESAVAVPTRSSIRLFLLALHFIISLGVAITITVMLVTILWQHSP